MVNGTALRANSLRVSYGEREVLRGVDVELRVGEVVGLVGPNGCGKTTLIKTLSGSLDVTSGEVLVDGAPVSKLGAREIAKRLAVVPQNPVLPPGFAARDIVVMGRTPYLGFLEQEGPADYRRADAALERVGAGELGDRRVEELSGGERQNVVLARALAQDTPVLLLDEPTANLDIGHQIMVAKLLQRLAHDTRAGVMAALHDLTLASLYCDRLILLAAGSVVADGAPADVLTPENLRSAYGADVAVLRPEGLSGPVVLPVEPD